jgi:hypothetical protein
MVGEGGFLMIHLRCESFKKELNLLERFMITPWGEGWGPWLTTYGGHYDGSTQTLVQSYTFFIISGKKCYYLGW